MRRETPMAGTGKNSIIYQLLTLSNHIIGTKFKVVLGYSTGRVLAVERGEVDGTGSTLAEHPGDGAELDREPVPAARDQRARSGWRSIPTSRP